MNSRHYFEEDWALNTEIELSSFKVVEVYAVRHVEGYTIHDMRPLSQSPWPPENIYTFVGDIEIKTECDDVLSKADEEEIMDFCENSEELYF